MVLLYPCTINWPQCTADASEQTIQQTETPSFYSHAPQLQVHSCLASAVEEEEARRRYSSESIECFIQWLSWGRWAPVGAAGDSGWTDEGVWPGCQVRLNEWKESHRSRWVGEQGQTDSMRKRDEKCHPRKQRFALPKHNCTVELAAGAPQSHSSSTPRWLCSAESADTQEALRHLGAKGRDSPGNNN